MCRAGWLGSSTSCGGVPYVPAMGREENSFVLTATGNTNPNKNIGTVQITSDITATLNAPGSGTYAGLIFFQDLRAAADFSYNGNSSNCANNNPGNCNHIEGGANMSLTGAIYLQQGSVGYQGNPSANCLILIADYYRLTGNPSLSSNGCAAAGVGVVTSTINKAVLTQ